MMGEQRVMQEALSSRRVPAAYEFARVVNDLWAFSRPSKERGGWLWTHFHTRQKRDSRPVDRPRPRLASATRRPIHMVLAGRGRRSCQSVNRTGIRPVLKPLLNPSLSPVAGDRTRAPPTAQDGASVGFVA
jgi:hypothetical protein